MKRILLLVILLYPLVSKCQLYTGANQITVRVLTTNRSFNITSNALSGRLNQPQKRFEFQVPVNSFRSTDSLGIDVFKNLFPDELTIYALIPDDRDGELDLSYFNTNKGVMIPGTLPIGNRWVKDVMLFKGLLIPEDRQELFFNLQLELDEQELKGIPAIGEKIIAIDIEAKGDKLMWLTSN